MRIKTMVTSSVVAVASTTWTLMTNTISLINLPGEASDALNTIVNAPVGMPIAISIIALGTLAWGIVSSKEDKILKSTDSTKPHKRTVIQGHQSSGHNIYVEGKSDGEL